MARSVCDALRTLHVMCGFPDRSVSQANLTGLAMESDWRFRILELSQNLRAIVNKLKFGHYREHAQAKKPVCKQRTNLEFVQAPQQWCWQ